MVSPPTSISTDLNLVIYKYWEYKARKKSETRILMRVTYFEQAKLSVVALIVLTSVPSWWEGLGGVVL